MTTEPGIRELQLAKLALLKEFGKSPWFRGVGIAPTDAGLGLRMNVVPEADVEEDGIPTMWGKIPIQIVWTRGYGPRES